LKRQSVVSIIKVGEEGVEQAVEEALELVGGIRSVVKPGEKVLIKPNYSLPRHPSTAVTTAPEVVSAVVELVMEAGGDPVIGEGSVVGHYTTMAFRVAGAEEISKRYGVPLVDLNGDEGVEVEIPNGKALKKVRVAKTALECDTIINVPKIKTHHSTLVTCSLKNMKGVLPAREKHVTHFSGLHQAIVDVNKVVRPNLNVVDGVLSMEGNGPSFGKPVATNLIVAGFDPVAVDSTICRAMGIDPKEVIHIRLAAEQGLGIMDKGAIEVRGFKAEDMRRDFARPSVPMASMESFGYKLEDFLKNVFHREVSFQRWFAKTFSPEPRFYRDACTGCEKCLNACPTNALAFQDGFLTIDFGECIRCYCCVEGCPSNALLLR